VGQRVKQYPEIARRIVAEGHQIANHSYSHPAFTKLKAKALDKQVEDTSTIIETTTGVSPTCIRPPYGALNDRVILSLLEDHGLNIILWNVDPQDWKRPGIDLVVERVVSGAKPGAVILLHDIHRETAEALPSILTSLLAKGYLFGTANQFLGIASYGSPLSRAQDQSPQPQRANFSPPVRLQAGSDRLVPGTGMEVGVEVQRPLAAPPGMVHGRAVPVMRAEPTVFED